MQNEQQKQANYYAVIPASVRYDKSLPMGARLLYGEITALSNKEGYCWASNNYFAELYETSKDTVSRWISALVKQGHVEIELIYKPSSKEIQSRRIYIVEKQINGRRKEK